MAVDYREILRKYIDIVGSAEGVDFLYSGPPEDGFTLEEWTALVEVANLGRHPDGQIKIRLPG